MYFAGYFLSYVTRFTSAYMATHFGHFYIFHRAQFFIFYFTRLWGMISEMIASEASCPTPGARRPRPWAKKPWDHGARRLG